MSLQLQRPHNSAIPRTSSSHSVPLSKNAHQDSGKPKKHLLPVIKTKLGGKLHSLTTYVLPGLEKYFLDNWPFPTKESRAEFVLSDLGLFTCYVFPMASDDRIELACRINNILFLTDDILDSYSNDEATSTDLHKQFAGLLRGDPNIKPASKIEEVLSDNIREMLATGPLGKAFCDTVLIWFHTCTNMKRRKHQATSNFEDFLSYRTVDSGAVFEMALMRWCIGDGSPTIPRDLAIVQQLEQVAANHLFLVNDLFSYSREVERMKEGELGAALVNGLAVIMNERGLSEEEATRWLEGYISDLEDQMERMIQEYNGEAQEVVQQYGNHLLEMMAGNLMWSLICGRYHGRLHG